MDPTTALVLSAPPEWLPILILAALLLKAWTAWVDKKKTAALVEANPPIVVPPATDNEPDISHEEVSKEPDVTG